MKIQKAIFLPFFTAIILLMFNENIAAQSEKNYLRIARLVIDSAKLESYKSALKEGMEAAVRVEDGVLSLNAVYEKNNPTHVTVFEIYADEKAYQFHIQTAHFKKYKSEVAGMVISLELVDVSPIAFESKKVKMLENQRPLSKKRKRD